MRTVQRAVSVARAASRDMGDGREGGGTAAVERVDPRSAGPPWSQEHLARYAEMVARSGAAGTVLDLACGSGFGAAFLRERGAERVVAVDLSAEATRDAHARLAAGRPGSFVVLRADGCRLPLPSECVDAIACFETLEHVEDDRGFLEELRRVLRPEGRLFLSTPNALVTNPEGGRPENPFHVREYVPDDLDRLVRGYFEIEWAGGQHLPARYGPAPFLPSFRREDLSVPDWLRFLRWRILLRLPPLRNPIHRLFTGFAFYPETEDYTFRAADRERAHVQYLVLRRRPE